MSACIVIPGGAAIALGIVFASAGIAKLRAPLAATRLMQRHAPAPFARLLPVPLGLAELGAGVALAVPTLRLQASIVVTLLLLLYTLAITIALARGAAGEDCGCGGIAGSVPIGIGLLLRNVALIALAAALALQPVQSAGSITQWIAILAVAALALALFVAVNFLLARATLMRDD